MARQIVGEIFLNVKPLDGGVAPGVQKIIDDAGRRISDGMEPIKRDIEDGVGGAWVEAAAQATAMTVAVYGVQRSIRALRNELSELYDSLTLARNGFNAILGEQAGGQLLEQIRTFAKDTPFITDTLVQYSQRLLGVGVAAEKIVPLLGNVGTIIASLGGDPTALDRVLYNLTQIQSIGRLTSRDLMDLSNALIPMRKILAEFYGTSIAEVNKLVTAGRVSAEDAFAALADFAEGKEDALANSVNTIRGAMDQLGESITILKQDSPFLQRIFEDTVKGIQGITEFLSREDVSAKISDISESLETTYEALRPAILGIADIMERLSLSGLDVLASSLNVLATVLNAFPAPVMENIGRALAILLAAQSPLLITKYIDAVTRTFAPLAQLIQRQVGVADSTRRANAELKQQEAILNGTASAADQASRQTSKLGLSFGTAAIAAGMLTKGLWETNEAAQVVGSALESAGFGASIGATFGPHGALIGGAIGAGAGLISGLISSAKEQAEAERQKLVDLGNDIANDIALGMESRFKDGLVDNESFLGIVGQFDQFGDAATEVERIENAIRTLNAQWEAINTQYLNSFYDSGFYDEALEAQLIGLEELIAAREKELKAARDNLTMSNAVLEASAEQLSVLAPLQRALRTLSIDTDNYNGLVDEFVKGLGLTAKEAEELTLALKGEAQIIRTEHATALTTFVKEALGLRNVTTLISNQDLVLRILSGTVLSVFDQMTLALQGYAERVKIVSDGIKTSFADLRAQMAQATNYISTFDKLNNAFEEYAKNNRMLNFEEGQYNFAGERELANQLVAAAEAYATTISLATDLEGPEAAAQAFGVIGLQLEEFRQQMGWTTEELEEFVRRNGLLEFYTAVQGEARGFSGSLEQLARTTGLTIEQLRHLLALPANLGDDTLINAPALVTEKLIELGEMGLGAAALSNPQLLRDIGSYIEHALITYGDEALSSAEKVIRERLDAMARRMSDWFADLKAEQSFFQQGASLGTAIGNFFLNDGEGSAIANQVAAEYERILNATNALTGNIGTAYSQAASYVQGINELLRESGMTNDEIRQLFYQTGNADIWQAAIGGAEAYVGTVSDVAKELGLVNAEALKATLGLQGLADGAQIIVTDELRDAIMQLNNIDFTNSESWKEQKELIDQLVKGGGIVFVDTSGPERVARERAEAEAERARQEAEREAERLAREAEREAERLAREAERLAEEQAREARRFAEAYKRAGETMSSAVESAAQAIRNAAQEWVASIKERTQQERAVPIERLLRNAAQQATDLDELGQGIEELRRRGLSDTAIDALEINNITDLRQVRRLLSADPSQLAMLSELVGQRDANAEIIARRQQQAETQATIVAAIIQAAQLLGYEVSKDQARALSAQIYVDGRIREAQLPPDLLEQLMNIGQLVQT